MKKITVISLVIAIAFAMIFMLITGAKDMKLQIRSTFIPQLSISYLKTLNGSQFYGQKDFNIQTYGEILTRGTVLEDINKAFPEIKATGISYDRREDSKILDITIVVSAKDVEDPGSVGVVIENYFEILLSKMSERSHLMIKEQMGILMDKLDELEKGLKSDIEKGTHEKFGRFFRKYRVNYGNAPIPGDVMLHGQGYSASTLILDQLRTIDPGKGPAFDTELTDYIKRLNRYNQSFSDAMRLESIENEIAFLSIAKISPLYHIGSHKITGSWKRILIKAFAVFLALFLIIFTILYVAKKD